jgi:hypothetical protein
METQHEDLHDYRVIRTLSCRHGSRHGTALHDGVQSGRADLPDELPITPARFAAPEMEMMMIKYIVMHKDKYGEQHQLRGAYEAVSEDDALAQLILESGLEDITGWSAVEVTDERDIIA